MKHLFVAILLLTLCVLPALAQPAYPTPEEKERARIADLLRQREAENRDLLTEPWADGELAVLRRMTAADIVKMQIFRVEWPQGVIDPRRKELYQKRYLTFHFGTERKNEVAALLALIARAPKYAPVREDPPLIPDRVLVVQPVKGEPFEFLYNSYLNSPFAGVYSRELKEALFALSVTTRLSIIHLEGDRVLDTINTTAIPPHCGSSASQTLAVALHLTPEKYLTLHLKLRDKNGDILLEDEQPVHYGEATVFTSPGPGRYIILLHQP